MEAFNPRPMETPTRIANLRCEYLVDPLGIDERAPRLSWNLVTSRQGARQRAYRIRVASSLEKLLTGPADRWDSGRVDSPQTQHVVYQGRPLESRDACHWHVEIWDETDASARSEPASWTMGLLDRRDWNARWIAADPETITRDPAAIAPSLAASGTPGVFRRGFDLSADVTRATLYISARGLVHVRVNSRPLTPDLFIPEWTDYDKRIHFRTYSVSTSLHAGRNWLEVTLGDGWWSGYVGWQETRARYGSLENSFLLQLEMELSDGRTVVVQSDRTWQCHTGPILSSDFMMGEVYDARREQDTTLLLPVAAATQAPGPSPELLASLPWLQAREVSAPAAPLVAQRAGPVRITEELVPISSNEVAPGVHVLDFGQNISGWIRLAVRAPRGTVVRLRHAERLNPDGTLYTDNLRQAKATDVYTCRGGDADEVYEPHFTFHGFQYVEITGLPGAPPPHAAVACVIHSVLPPGGSFECSHPGVNRLWLNGVWSQRDNFLSVPTDCPQRDERLGWTGDAQVFIRTASYNKDVAAFFTKWMIDVDDAQTPEGIFPDIAPRLRDGENYAGLGNLCGAAGWGDAGIIVPWTIWRVYGDRRIMERHWRAMEGWMDWIEDNNPGYLRVNQLGHNYGDWLCIPTDTSFGTHSPMKNLLATAYWADDAAKMAVMAHALGRDEDAARHTRVFVKVREAFQKEFLGENGRLTVETQTAYLLALAFNLLPESDRPKAAEHLVRLIRDLDWHLSTGFIGIGHLNPVLTETGHADVAYRLLLQESYPSWLYPIRHGATTIWERWNGWTHQDGFFNPQMNSFNHYSLGSVGEWLFRHVGGIELDPKVPGFERFVLKPWPGKGLDFANVNYRCPHGDILSHWKLAGSSFEWKVVIPPNTRARIFLPSDPDTEVVCDGLSASERIGGFAVCDALAGQYTLHSTLTI